MGLFGVTLAGAPICGAVNASSADNGLVQVDEEQLCIRWYQMGLLLPFAHSTTKLNHRLRSPVDWSLNARRILAGYIRERYRLLPYFYTLFYQVLRGGVETATVDFLFGQQMTSAPSAHFRPARKGRRWCGLCGTSSRKTMRHIP